MQVITQGSCFPNNAMTGDKKRKRITWAYSFFNPEGVREHLLSVMSGGVIIRPVVAPSPALEDHPIEEEALELAPLEAELPLSEQVQHYHCTVTFITSAAIPFGLISPTYMQELLRED